MRRSTNLRKKRKKWFSKKNEFDKNDALTGLLLAMQVEQRQARRKTDTKVDSLLQLMNTYKYDSLVETNLPITAMQVTDESAENLNALKNQIYVLQAKLDRVMADQIEAAAQQKVENAVSLTDTIYLENTKEVDPAQEAFEARKREYDDYFKQVFFANNSTKIEPEYTSLISDIVNQLNNEPKIDVTIEGFASKTGNAKYNQEISMKRALALKTLLMEKGIPAKRILTDYKGIDYDVENSEEARRLDIQFYVRK